MKRKCRNCLTAARLARTHARTPANCQGVGTSGESALVDDTLVGNPRDHEINEMTGCGNNGSWTYVLGRVMFIP